MAKIYNNILDTIGRTPLVKLNRITDGAKATVLLKLEFFNPLGSVKDRIGLAMIDHLEKTQGIAAGKTTLIEATSGNTGIALAFVAAAKGYDLIITMPDTASTERKKLLKILGARLVLTEGAKGMKGAIARAEELKTEIKDSAIPSQFESPSNPEIHLKTTGPEIWEDTDGQVDILISGVGTGGTITGVSEYIKPKKPSFKAIALEPEGSPVISGGEPGKHRLQGLGAGFIPKTLHTEVIDETIRINEELAAEYAKRACREEGIPVGISSGAAIWAACEVAKRPENEGKTIVAIVPSSAERYLSTWLFEDISSESDDISDLLQGS